MFPAWYDPASIATGILGAEGGTEGVHIADLDLNARLPEATLQSGLDAEKLGVREPAIGNSQTQEQAQRSRNSFLGGYPHKLLQRQ